LQGDCDDQDPDTHPGATEDGSEADRDCNGEPDTFWVQEGWGHYVSVTTSTDYDGDGFSTEDGDCNDQDAGSAPNLAEDCRIMGYTYRPNEDNTIAYGYRLLAQDNDCDGFLDNEDPDCTRDRDGDGVTMGDGDCDDNDPYIYPGAPELCDAWDNNCNGLEDEGAPECDADGDGWSYTYIDCDDTNPAVHEMAEEICDGIDNNCWGGVDEDADRDGYGCDQDCDQRSHLTYPGAPELCDGQDNDCDGQIDEGVSEDLDGDGYSPEDGDCNDLDGTVYPDAGCDTLDTASDDTGFLWMDVNCNGVADMSGDCE
jgi:hypothetical protein